MNIDNAVKNIEFNIVLFLENMKAVHGTWCFFNNDVYYTQLHTRELMESAKNFIRKTQYQIGWTKNNTLRDFIYLQDAVQLQLKEQPTNKKYIGVEHCIPVSELSKIIISKFSTSTLVKDDLIWAIFGPVALLTRDFIKQLDSKRITFINTQKSLQINDTDKIFRRYTSVSPSIKIVDCAGTLFNSCRTYNDHKEDLLNGSNQINYVLRNLCNDNVFWNKIYSLYKIK